MVCRPWWGQDGRDRVMRAGAAPARCAGASRAPGGVNVSRSTAFAHRIADRAAHAASLLGAALLAAACATTPAPKPMVGSSGPGAGGSVTQTPFKAVLFPYI